jgi:hypothetical protein
MLIMLLMTLSITTVFIVISIGTEYRIDEAKDIPDIRSGSNNKETVTSLTPPRRGSPGRRIPGGSR